MDREAILHLARLYGSATDDTRRRNINLQCPMAPVSHEGGVNPRPALAVKVEPHGKSPAFCRSCGASGTLLSVFREANERIGGLDEAVAYIAETDRPGLAGALARLRVDRLEAEHRRDPASDWAGYAARCSRQVPRYLFEKRGIVKRDVERWRIGFDAELARATFPVWDEDRNVVGVSRRTVIDEEPKFLDTPGDWKHRVFYGENFFDATREHAHLVEGVLATIIADRTLPNVLGMLGASSRIDGERLDKLQRWCRSVTIVFDADDAGDRAVEGWTDPRGKYHPGLRETLRPHFIVKVAHLPRGCDPADVSPQILRDAVENADYLLRP